jgi:hypothetical protein
MGERGLRRVNRQMRGELTLSGDMTLLDTGALHDPFIGRVNLGRQFGIGQDPLWKIRTAT